MNDVTKIGISMTASIGANAIKALKVMLAAILAFSISIGPTVAQGVPLVRDAEMEALIRDYSQPIFKAAGLKSNFVAIHLVRSNQFNAFVANGRRMFINLGTLRQADTPNEVIGVIAHEAGHIAGGHLTRIRQTVSGARTISIVSSILAGAAIVAGAAAVDRGRGAAMGGCARRLWGQVHAQAACAARARAQAPEPHPDAAPDNVPVLFDVRLHLFYPHRHPDPAQRGHA